ncbi:MAG: Uma2 family endonuclease [Xenococcaceae cyanobacterium]
MIQIAPKPITFEKFLEWYPDQGRYELIDGKVVSMQPTGKHEEITEFLSRQLILEAAKQKLTHRFPKQALVKAPSWETGYLPDIILVDCDALSSEPLWQKAATITKGQSIPVKSLSGYYDFLLFTFY